jgi:hypothetical protein
LGHKPGEKPQKRKPSSEWRQFEELVALIERTLSPSGAIVKSPDRLIDLLTGQYREVDASIRYKIGSVHILITIECRKRSRVQDDTWIEQLAKKREKIGAAKTIAVSSRGFSAPALKTAELSGIEARTISEITREDVADWSELQFIHYFPPSIGVHEVHFFDETGRDVPSHEIEDSVHEAVLSLRSYAPVLQCERGAITPNDIVQSWQNANRGTELDLEHGVEIGGDSVKRAVIAPVASGEYWLNCKQGKLFVTAVGLLVEVRATLKLIPINQIYRYQGPDEAIVDGVEFVIPEFDPRTKMPLRVLLQKGVEYGFKATMLLEGESSPETK